MDKKKTVNIDMKQYGMVLALIAVFLIFAVMTGGKNMSPANINNLIMQNGYVVILAVGMLLCCLTGNIDLGVGSIVALCGATVGILMIDYHTNMWSPSWLPWQWAPWPVCSWVCLYPSSAFRRSS